MRTAFDLLEIQHPLHMLFNMLSEYRCYAFRVISVEYESELEYTKYVIQSKYEEEILPKDANAIMHDTACFSLEPTVDLTLVTPR